MEGGAEKASEHPMTAAAHIERVRKHHEIETQRAALRARTILDLVNLLAQARPYVTNNELQIRISAALINSHIAFNGEFLIGGAPDVIPIWSKDGFDPKRAEP